MATYVVRYRYVDCGLTYSSYFHTLQEAEAYADYVIAECVSLDEFSINIRQLE